MNAKTMLIKGGTVMTLDERAGPFGSTFRGDVLVEDGRIAAVDRHLDAPAAEHIDATDCLVMPGLIDTHRHVWQTALRGVCHDDTLKGYMREIRFLRARAYRPEDIRTGNYVGMLEAINAGITAVWDFSHCVNTPAHADAALEGLVESGARAVFGYGFNEVPLDSPHFTSLDARVADLHRIAARFPAARGRVTCGVATSDVPICGIERLQAEIQAARELGLPISIHSNTWEFPEREPEVTLMDQRGLLGPDLLFVHSNLSSDEEIRRIADTGGWIASTPETEMQMSMGPSVIGRFSRAGGKPTFGCDIISNNSGDLLTQARLGLQTERMLECAESLRQRHGATEITMTTADMVRAMTVNAAGALGLADRIGTLTVGKDADLILLRLDDINTIPLHDPCATLLLHAHPGNVDTVMVAGRVLKRHGRLVADLASVRRAIMASHAHIQSAIERDRSTLPPGYQAA
ncbi:MAG: amidohydrolase family protein [Gammaproteobacteria bacterium]